MGLKTSVEKDLAPNAPSLDVLTIGHKYYDTIKAKSAAGLHIMSISNEFTVDPSPPTKTAVVTQHVVTDQEERSIEIRAS